MRLFKVVLPVLVIFFLVTGAAPGARAQLADEFNPPPGNCCLASQAQTLANQLQDWNQLGRYHADNMKLRSQSPTPNRVVFMGDSITDMWRLEKSFPGKPYVNRGISGQTTPQMLTRMFSDVINLRPAALVLFAGTNDIARNTGPTTLDMIADNFRAMSELARAHQIRVIICSVTPVSDYTLWPQTGARPPRDILRLNAWLKKYAAETDAEYVDYHSALVDEKGFLKDGFSMDGLHPNEKGYELMAPLVAAAIERTLAVRGFQTLNHPLNNYD